MPPETLKTYLPAALEAARADAIGAALPYAGMVSPGAAWALVSNRLN